MKHGYAAFATKKMMAKPRWSAATTALSGSTGLVVKSRKQTSSSHCGSAVTAKRSEDTWDLSPTSSAWPFCVHLIFQFHIHNKYAFLFEFLVWMFILVQTWSMLCQIMLWSPYVHAINKEGFVLSRT